MTQDKAIHACLACGTEVWENEGSFLSDMRHCDDDTPMCRMMYNGVKGSYHITGTRKEIDAYFVSRQPGTATHVGCHHCYAIRPITKPRCVCGAR